MPTFELHLTFPTDARYADTLRALAVHAARQAGCSDAKAHAFGEEVAGVIRGYLEGGGDGSVPVVVRRSSGPVEVLINGRTLTPDP